MRVTVSTVFISARGFLFGTVFALHSSHCLLRTAFFAACGLLLAQFHTSFFSGFFHIYTCIYIRDCTVTAQPLRQPLHSLPLITAQPLLCDCLLCRHNFACFFFLFFFFFFRVHFSQFLLHYFIHLDEELLAKFPATNPLQHFYQISPHLTLCIWSSHFSPTKFLSIVKKRRGRYHPSLSTYICSHCLPRSSPLSRYQVRPSSLVPDSFTFLFNKLMPHSFSLAMPSISFRRTVTRLWTGVSWGTARVVFLLFGQEARFEQERKTKTKRRRVMRRRPGLPAAL